MWLPENFYKPLTLCCGFCLFLLCIFKKHVQDTYFQSCSERPLVKGNHSEKRIIIVAAIGKFRLWCLIQTFWAPA